MPQPVQMHLVLLTMIVWKESVAKMERVATAVQAVQAVRPAAVRLLVMTTVARRTSAEAAVPRL